jgi:hypothetical protein
MIGTGNFENDTWQLFHTDTDRSEAHDLADQHPDKVRQLVDLWYAEPASTTSCPWTTARWPSWSPCSPRR